MIVYGLYAICLFLFVLVGSLRGSAKQSLENLFFLLLLGLVVWGIYAYGWSSILIFLSIWLLAGNLVIGPLALAVARRLIANPVIGVEEFNRVRLKRFVKNFGSVEYSKTLDKTAEEEIRHKADTISMARSIPAIAKILAQYDATERDLATLYDCLAVRSLPPHLRATVITNASLVAFFLENSSPCCRLDGSYERHLSKSASLQLQLWIQSNPAGTEHHV